jgi:hypothetical protein
MHRIYGKNITSATCQQIDFILKFLIHSLIALPNLEFKKDQKPYIKHHSPVMNYLMNVMNVGYCSYFHGLYCDALCRIHIGWNNRIIDE